MSLIAPQDSAFLLGETAAQPTHVAGLAVYELPPGAGPDYVSRLYHEMLTHTEIHPRLGQRPRSGGLGPARAPSGLGRRPDERVPGALPGI